VAIDYTLPLLSPFLSDSGSGQVKPNSSKGYRPGRQRPFNFFSITDEVSIRASIESGLFSSRRNQKEKLLCNVITWD